MSGRGRKVAFHGAFAKKADAIRKERSRPGSYIRRVKIKRQVRYLVLWLNCPIACEVLIGIASLVIGIGAAVAVEITRPVRGINDSSY
jgi:hypothetical protein